MLIVMDPHRLLVDVRLERVIGIREGWNFVGHHLLLVGFQLPASCFQLVLSNPSQSASQHIAYDGHTINWKPAAGSWKLTRP
jgi:hypothetical protein